ncbi:MAG: PepSY domain-containing protein, partial [Gluconobacter sp.]|uniref:hypothetical protein n=1 Tax=Gluconobacter sp. TaxID=1876758 RepID=UPI0039ED6531
GYGVAAHEGQLFGKANQFLNFLVAVGLLTMSIAALVLWFRRKPPGRLGVPPVDPNKKIGVGALVILIVLGLLLPELGASLLLLCLATLLSRAARRTP